MLFKKKKKSEETVEKTSYLSTEVEKDRPLAKRKERKNPPSGRAIQPKTADEESHIVDAAPKKTKDSSNARLVVAAVFVVIFLTAVAVLLYFVLKNALPE